MTRATWLADVLRAAGLKVVEHNGWKTRGAAFPGLRAVVWHHDASGAGDSPGVPAYMLRQMAQGKAAAQLWVDRKGTWHVLASGVAFHAGKVLPGKPGNGQSLGVETDHTTGEAWPAAQLASLRTGTAAILRRLGQDTGGLHMHKTICDPPGRKSDPDGLELHSERGRVAVLMANSAPKPTPAPEPAPPVPPVQEDDMYAVVSDPSNGGDYGTNGVVKFPFESQEAKNDWAKAFKAERITLSLPAFDAIPTVERAL